MALIKCPECHKDISDECKKCPQCGYTLKKKNNTKSSSILKSISDVFKENKTYSFFKNKISLSSLQILSLVALLCSFIVGICESCFTRSVYPSGSYLPSQITLDNFHWALAEDSDYIFIWYFMIIAIILSVVSIIIYNSKFNKLKKKIILYIPNVIYSITILATIILASSGDLGRTFTSNHSQYDVKWGAIYVLILSVTSVILLIIDIKKNKKEN